jgi:YHS domain-containing protein/thiol-disulfide isomerase/thioredoxin
MSPRVFRVLVFTVLGSALHFCLQGAQAGEPGSLPWRDDFARAQEEARSRNRPLWVQFTGPWCGYCRRMESEVFVSPEIIALARDQFIPVQVQSDVNEELVARFDLSGLPATYLLDPSGRVIAKQEGYADPRSFRQFLDEALTRLARFAPRGEAVSRHSLPSLPPNEPVSLTGPGPANTETDPRVGGGSQQGIALGGLCPVSLVQEHRLVPGQRSLSWRLNGDEYWFASAAYRDAFRRQPEAFLPVDEGRCVVSRLDSGLLRPGQARFGLVYQDRIYLCADAVARDRFARDPERYANTDVADLGYCPHCRNQFGRLVRGSPRFALQHAGRRFFFPNAEHLAAFRDSPEKYLR